MRIMKAGLNSLKADNSKLMNVRSEQAEIIELILKSLTDKATQRNNGHNSCSVWQGKHVKIKFSSCEETLDSSHPSHGESEDSDEPILKKQNRKPSKL